MSESDGDAFALAQRDERRSQLVQRVIVAMLSMAVVFAMVVFAVVSLVRGTSIQRAEGRDKINQAAISSLTSELASLRHDLGSRDQQDACVSRVGGALQIAIGRILLIAFDPPRLGTGAELSPDELSRLGESLATLNTAIQDRELIASTCDTGG